MDNLQFISSVVNSVAWPLAVVFIVVLLRKAILRLLRRLRMFRFRELEFEFSEKLAEAERDASKLNVVLDRTLPDALQADRYLKLAQISPSAAILEAWLEVETVLLELAREKAPDFPRIKTLTSKLRLLQQIDIIDAETSALVGDLRALRNLAVHPDSSERISTSDAERYRLTAIKVIAALKKLLSR